MNLAILLATLLAASPAPDGPAPFAIEVVDEQTGRGVPLVELTTVHNVTYVTDSAGVVAFDEPGLMDTRVFFQVKSHGYEFAADGFGYRGAALDVKPGGSATLKIRRLNIAERLYRVTGAGIYRDSLFVGRPAPIREPVLNGQVFGSDSVINAQYGDKLWWFWGDTNRPGYPLGNFHVPGATSDLPADGGLDPDRGVDLTYLVGDDGFARPTAKLPGEGPTWIFGLVALRDGSGRERMFAGYSKVKPPMEVYERGLVEFDPEAKAFAKAATFPIDGPLFPDGHAVVVERDGKSFVHFSGAAPLVRVAADPESLRDPKQYEAFTCLFAGSRMKEPQVERDAEGRPVYAWKADTPPTGPAEARSLVEKGLLKADEAIVVPRDPDTGQGFLMHNGGTCWNPWRGRWTLVATEVFGKPSMLGEIWYAESDAPEGPWAYARKILTHDKYSFYNPKWHPYFFKEDGRIAYFEGTYTASFSGNDRPTPRYEYNQIMHKLDLGDPRLNLPVAVYRAADGRLGTARSLPTAERGSIAFFALERPGEGTLALGDPAAGGTFHVRPFDLADPPANTLPLYEWAEPDGPRRAYATEPDATFPGLGRRVHPIGLAWANPVQLHLPR